MDYLSSITGWTFQNEPLWKWFMFVGAMMAILWSWNGIIQFIK